MTFTADLVELGFTPNQALHLGSEAIVSPVGVTYDEPANKLSGVWTPSYEGASGTFASVVTTQNRFALIGRSCHYGVEGIGTLNTTSAYLVVDLPFNSTEADFTCLGLGQIRRNAGANWELAQVAKHSVSENKVRVIPVNGVSITNSAGVGLRAFGLFQAALS